jgi:hypothetical protein
MSVAYERRHEDYQAICVDPQFVETLFPQIKHHLQAAREAHGLEFHADATLADLKNKDMLLWLPVCGAEIFGACTTQLIKGDGGELICLILGLGGAGMKQWLHLIEDIEQYARDEGCARMRIEGRRGWQRALPEYQRTGVILERRL